MPRHVAEASERATRSGIFDDLSLTRGLTACSRFLPEILAPAIDEKGEKELLLQPLGASCAIHESSCRSTPDGVLAEMRKGSQAGTVSC